MNCRLYIFPKDHPWSRGGLIRYARIKEIAQEEEVMEEEMIREEMIMKDEIRKEEKALVLV